MGTAEGQRIPVSDLGRHGRVWLLSWEGRDALLGDEGTVCNGFGLPYPKPFSAVFAHAERLWLQVGRRRWDVADIAQVQQAAERLRIARYELHLTNGSAERVVVRVPWGVALMRILDPTHDEIASWSEDIVKVLPYTGADGWSAGGTVAEWAADTLPKWQAGITPHG